jgi:hypothetical protein
VKSRGLLGDLGVARNIILKELKGAGFEGVKWMHLN